MPVVILGGEPLYVPMMGGSKNVTERWFTSNGQVRVRRTSNQAHGDSANDAWSKEEHKRLRELKASRIPWKHISVVLGNRPVEHLKKRWGYLQGDLLRCKEREIAGMVEYVGDRCINVSIPGGKTKDHERTERHVSFSEPLVVAGDNDDSASDLSGGSNDKDQSKKVRRIIYIEEEFSLDDVILLHRIAGEWERDRWLCISDTFNEKTGQSMTPEQAKSILDRSEFKN